MDRHSDYEISELILSRWSPRAFSPKPIDERRLESVIEAARWAPSCFNEQPWRFVIAKSQEDKERFLGFLADSNKIWASQAPILITLIAKNSFAQNNKPNRWNGFDAGCAWGYLALEARNQGLYAHAMGGFDKNKAKVTLDIPEDCEVYAVIALGEIGDPDSLPVDLQAREQPADRKPLADIIHIGVYDESK